MFVGDVDTDDVGDADDVPVGELHGLGERVTVRDGDTDGDAPMLEEGVDEAVRDCDDVGLPVFVPLDVAVVVRDGEIVADDDSVTLPVVELVETAAFETEGESVGV